MELDCQQQGIVARSYNKNARNVRTKISKNGTEMRIEQRKIGTSSRLVYDRVFPALLNRQQTITK